MPDAASERDPLIDRSQRSSRSQSRSARHRQLENEPFRSPSRSTHESRGSASSGSLSAAGSEKPNALFILPLNFFNAFGWSLIEVPLIYLLRTRICELQFGDKPGSLPYELDKCRTDNIQMYVSGIRAGFQTIAAVLGLLTTTFYGSMSDAQGRRKVLLICSVFQLVGDVSLLAIVMLPGYANPYFVLISAVFKGFGGYISAIVAGQNSFVADCTTSESRSRYLGWNFATYHLGTAAGPLISGVLVAKYDRMDLVYAMSVTLWGLYFLYTYFILPESNRPTDEDEDGEELYSLNSEASTLDVVKSRMQRLRSFLFKNFVEPLAIVMPSRSKTSFDCFGPSTEAKRHWDVCIAAVLIGMALFSTGSMGMLPLYTDFKLQWGPLKASLLMSVDGGASAFTLTLIFPLTCWAIGKFLRQFSGVEEAWDDLGISIPWLSSQDSDQPPSNFYPGHGPTVHKRRQGSDARSSYAHTIDDEDSEDERVAEFRTISKKITVVKRDIWVARIGYLAAALAVAGVAMAKTDAQMYISIIIQSLSNIALPAVQSIALNGVRSEYNGRILAGFAIVESLALVVRGPVYAGIYNLSLPSSPNVIYWTSAAVYILCLLTLSVVKLYRPLGSNS